MKSKLTLTFGLVFSLFLFLTAGCSVVRSPIIEPVVLDGEELEDVLSYAQSPAENLIDGLIARDYEQFSQDFSDTMKKGMNQQSFDDLLVMLDTKLGTYQSFDLVTVLQDENFSTLVYRLTYEKDNQVSMRVVFDNESPHPISGLWFDSPELRQN